MLKEIRCEHFRNAAITFHSGLNVILGDQQATNSIGKSTLLMIVDFAFGGNSLIEYNTDISSELGAHDYLISFQFNDSIYRFRRGTSNHKFIYPCNDKFEPTQPITLEDYCLFLKQSYKTQTGLTFRALTGLYSRIWGKKNLDVHRPLHIVPDKSQRECVNEIIETFNQFEPIRALGTHLKQSEERRSALNSAFKNGILPKITKRHYKENVAKIEISGLEIEEIKTNLAKYATNISEILNREMLELKNQKDELLELKLKLDNKRNRLLKNLSRTRQIKGSNFIGVVKLFPEINEPRLASIEEFHEGLSKILRDEIKTTLHATETQIIETQREITRIDEQMAKSVTSVKQPTKIIDRVFDLSSSLQSAKLENEYHDKFQVIETETKELKQKLKEEKAKILAEIESEINGGIHENVTAVFGKDKKSPEISLTPNSYTYEVLEDTGTGTAYESLIVFDLTIFQLTPLPILIHDSLLFKNIENQSVANLIKIYTRHNKQSFIAIDEINKYGKEAASTLLQQHVIKLDAANTLYNKNWRKQNEPREA